jgi:translocation and assembly module TamA
MGEIITKFGLPIRLLRCPPAIVVLGVVLLSACTNSTGPYRPWVHRIYFHGIHQLKESDVRSKLVVQQSSRFPLLPRKYLDHPMMVSLDRQRIIKYYQTRGFFLTKVPQAEIKTYKRDAKQPPTSPRAVKAVDINYTIEEGPPFLLNELTLDGLSELPAAVASSVRKELPSRTGTRFEYESYEDTKALLLDRLQKHGYAFARLVNSEVTVDKDAHTVQVHLLAEPGHKVKFGQVELQGMEHVDPVAVRKHIVVPTGQDYKPETLATVQGSLYDLGIFSTVLVEPMPDLQNENVADVRITVKEGKYRDLRIGGGLGIEPLRNEVHGELLYTQRRFLGGLRVLQLTVQAGYAVLPAIWSWPLRRQGPIGLAKAEFTQPDLFGRLSKLVMSLSYEVGVQYAYQYQGPTFRLGGQKGLFHNQLSFAASYNFQFLGFFAAEAGLNGTSSNDLLFGYISPYRLGYLQEQVTLDLRNRPLNATRGVYLQLAAEEGGPYTGSEFSYQKLMTDGRFYHTFFGRLTLAARVQFGHIFSQGPLGSPITQRFYLGGPDSHRGFSYNRLSYQMCSVLLGTPQRPTPELLNCQDPAVAQAQTGSLDYLPIGGDTALLGQLELRLRMFRLAGNWVTLATFVDAGDVSPPSTICATGVCNPNGLNLDLTKLHVAVGGGLRYDTVIGTVRVDLGVRVNRLDPFQGPPPVLPNPDPGQPVAYHISIGEAF